MVDDTDLGTFLRSRRARVQPGDIGLLVGNGTRRTQGLRREEVATVTGISVDYYTRLEQGRERNPSYAVLDALTATLRLGHDERAHLFRLGANSGHRKHTRTQWNTSQQEVPAAVRQILDTVSPAPAYLLNRRNDLLAANSTGLTLLAGIDQWPPARRNTIRYIFLHPAARKLFVNWNTIAASAVAHLRAMSGLHPDDQALTELIDELSGKSAEFPLMWQQHDVRTLATGSKTFDHPHVGTMELTYEALEIARLEQRCIIYQAEPNTPDYDAMMLLDLGHNNPGSPHDEPRREPSQHASE